MHLIYLSFNIFCIFEKTYVNISILLSFNMLAVNLMSLVIFHACYITPPLERKVLWIQISPSILPFLCPSLTQFSRNWIKSFFCFFSQNYSQKNFVIVFLWIWSKAQILFIAMFLHKYHIWEKFGYWDMGQNALAGFSNQT